MLTRENNELICRVGPDTAMSKALRQYGLPFCKPRTYHRRIAILSRLNWG
jgi:hypothetical protein